MANKVSEIWSRAASALAGRPTPEQMGETMQEITARLQEIEARQRDLYDGQPPGPERLRVLNSGSPEDLVKLDGELRALRAEEAQLLHRRAELNRRQRQALAERGVEGAAQNRKAMAEAVDKAEQAHQAFRKALAEADRAAQRILEARFAARAVQHEGERECYADPEPASRLAKMIHPEDGMKRVEYLRELAPKAARAEQEQLRKINPGSWRERPGTPLGA